MQAVESTRLDTLMPQYEIPGLIDYISIDVDGPEYEVLSGFPFDKYEVILWTIEHNIFKLGPDLKNNIKRLMENNGYVVAVENVQDGEFIMEDWYINKRYARLQGAV